MLKILDKYIIKKYLSTFFFVMLLFTMIATAIDFSDKIQDYIDEPCTKKEIIFDYTINFILFINGMLMPIYVLIGVIFFTARMAENAEMISILNAGVPFRRILRPYLIAGSVVTILYLLGTHYFVPNGNKHKLDFERKYIHKRSDKGKKDNVHLFIGKDSKAYIRYYSPSDSMIRDLRIEKIEQGEVKGILEASSAQWHGNTQKWTLNTYEIRTFDGLKETLVKNYITALDTALNLHPRDFVFYENEKDRMTTPELLQSINQERLRGAFNPKNFEIEFHRRTAEPFMVLILTVLGLSIAGRKVRGGMGLHLAIGIGLGAVYIFISRFSATFANSNDLPAYVGVWIPNILYGIIAAYAVSKAQK
jgi:lipopolysaccharide export system permease protein